MKIIILGAGRLGKQLAWTLLYKNNQIVVVDSSRELLETLRERQDVMTVHGDGASFGVLKKAGVYDSRILIAVTGSDACNILACQIARHAGIEETICRVSTADFFSEEDDFPPEYLGIKHLIFPEDMCIKRIIGVLEHRSLVEKVAFPGANAHLSAIRISPSSTLKGMQIKNFPDEYFLANNRFSAIIRNQNLVVPHGDTFFEAFDEVYVAGREKCDRPLMNLADPGATPVSLVIVAGATRIGKKLVRQLLAAGYMVRMIEDDLANSERLLDDLGERIMVINGDSTDAEVQEEAGVAECGAFIATLPDDEKNILSCLLAKKIGANKTVTVTNKAEYTDIVPAMAAIDCGFSPRLVAVNDVLNLLGLETGRIHAILHRFHAYVYEFEVQSGSWACGRKISGFHTKSPDAIFSMVFRDNDMLPATGELELREGDRVAIVGTSAMEQKLVRLFRRKRLSI